MNFAIICGLWLMAFACHVRLQPARYRFARLTPHGRRVAVMGRIAAPACALMLAIRPGGITGVLTWFGSLSIMGLLVALWLALRHRPAA
ncbi:hypothetical protein LU298_05115 [Komagataeibacter intermedius]|uniref:DUF3325 domain-containing protein n=2 Tax=Komagataeibacter intermedius TaxID=66229 RepID=A0A0N1FMV0_9PROT|nr:hypothetical protein [Komagataeibacter intermedius]KPH88189.1 hypothetical protein GLUCOINTEAF2_0201784 [Komagataeibacter intermedius AF2]MCF3635880.1 hypothetical protein [Komagataeibacter intermedius]GAN86407.1 hypothetical protein Gain_0027_082 [Komagataeibacter intermedius TF2]GBQ68138.1 hypothetical protein AA0521_1165 [Komagataeibacter intermedius NRIC 0521]